MKIFNNSGMQEVMIYGFATFVSVVVGGYVFGDVLYRLITSIHSFYHLPRPPSRQQHTPSHELGNFLYIKIIPHKRDYF